MDKRKRKKIVVITACIVVLLGVFLGVEYNKYREKPLLPLIPISQDEVAKAWLSYDHGNNVKLDDQQIAELWDILDGCTVKFWSTSNLSGYYGDIWLCSDPPPSEMPKDVVISLSDNGRVAAYELRSTSPKYRYIYKFVEGEEAVYQFLDKMQWQE